MTHHDQPGAPAKNPVLAMLRGLLWDVGLPVLAYYVLHLLGASDWLALLTASAVAAARIGWTALLHRTLNQFATVMLLVYGIGLALALVTGDPRALLLKNSLITGAVGIVFLATAIHGRRPLTLSAMQSFAPDRAAILAERYRTDPAVHRGFRLSSLVWGAGLLAEALVRLPLVYLLPIDVSVGATEGLLIATFVLLAGWNVWYMRRFTPVDAPE